MGAKVLGFCSLGLLVRSAHDKMLLVDKYRPQSLKKMDYHTDMSEHLQNLVRDRTLDFLMESQRTSHFYVLASLTL